MRLDHRCNLVALPNTPAIYRTVPLDRLAVCKRAAHVAQNLQLLFDRSGLDAYGADQSGQTISSIGTASATIIISSGNPIRQ